MAMRILMLLIKQTHLYDTTKFLLNSLTNLTLTHVKVFFSKQHYHHNGKENLASRNITRSACSQSLLQLFRKILPPIRLLTITASTLSVKTAI